jgi:hypothetical protein
MFIIGEYKNTVKENRHVEILEEKQQRAGFFI